MSNMINILDNIQITTSDEHNLRGVALVKERKIIEAIEAFDLALEENSKNIDAIFNKAICFYVLGNMVEARELLKKCIFLDKKLYKAYMFLGDISFFLDKNADEALMNYNRAIAGGVENELIHLNRAFVYFMKKDYTSSIRAYNKALIINPTSKKATVGKIESYFAQRKFKEAEECLEQLRISNPESEEFYTWAALIYIVQDREEDAFKVLDEADIVIGYNNKIALARIKVYEKIKDFKQAINYINEVKINLEKSQEEYYKLSIMQVEYLMKLEDINKAKEILKDIYLYHKNEEIEFKIGNIALTQLEFEEALEYFNKVIDRGLENNSYFTTAIYLTGVITDRQGNKDKAIKMFEEALVYNKAMLLVHPADINIITSKALCLYQLNRLDEAEKEIQNALRISPNKKELLLVAIKVAHKSGNMTLAKLRMNALNKLEPKMKDLLAQDPEFKEVLE